jgi:hypothetical protein
MTPEDKRVFLASKRVINAIRKVAASHKVPKQDWEEVVQQTSTFAWKARLPVDEGEAGKVTNKIAVTVCCKMMTPDPLGQRSTFTEESTEEEGEATPVAEAQPDAELRDGLEQVVDKAREEFGVERVDEYVAAKMKAETAVEVASRRGVTDGHVRKEWSDINKFMRVHGRKLGLLAVAILVVVTGIPMSRWLHEPAQYGPKAGFSDFASIHRDHPKLANTPERLRLRARFACENAAWEACIADIEGARALDPSGDTYEVTEMEQLAKMQLQVTGSDERQNQMPEDYVKVPLH